MSEEELKKQKMQADSTLAHAINNHANILKELVAAIREQTDTVREQMALNERACQVEEAKLKDQTLEAKVAAATLKIKAEVAARMEQMKNERKN